MTTAYYAQLDSQNTVLNIVQGDPTGRFSDTIKWVPCTEEVKIGDTYISETGNYVERAVTLQDGKLTALRAISQIAQGKINTLVSGYPTYECNTWPYQVEEARQLLADENASAYLLRAIAEGRHINIMELAKRVLANDVGFRILSGRVIAKRQYFEDVIDGCDNLNRLAVINDEIKAWKEEGASL